MITHSSFRYLTPFVFFMLVTEFQRWFSGETLFWFYGIKSLLTALLLIFLFRNHRHEIEGRYDLKAVGIGMAAAIMWFVFFYFLGPKSNPAFNPNIFQSQAAKTLAIMVRLTGAALVVPVMEELVWRSFLMRYLIQSDFLKVRLGTYAPASFWITVIAFTLVHRTWEWPAAFLTGLLYGGYMIKTKNLIGCIHAHALTNLCLGVYALVTNDWRLW